MASINERLSEAFNSFRNPTKQRIDFNPTKAKPQSPPQEGYFSGYPKPPLKNTNTYLREAYQSWTFAAIQAIAREVASIELKLFRRGGDEPEEIQEHEALSLLHESNRFTTFYMLVEMEQIYQEITGEGFWALLRPGNSPTGEILEIWNLRPDWVEVVDDPIEYIKGYIYKPPGSDGIFFPKENIIPFKYPNPINPYRGKGTVEAAALAIDVDTFSAEYNRNFFFNSALPSMVFTTKENIAPESLKQLKVEWDNAYRGRSNAHRVGWLSGGFEPKPLVSMQEGDFLEQRKQVRDEILAIFGVPKSVIGITEDVNRANADASKAVFLESVIKPKMMRFVAHLNEFYLKQFPGSENLYFDFEDPAPTDVEAKIKIYESGKGYWLTPNEIRAQENLDPIEGGDSIYMPINLQPLDRKQELIDAGLESQNNGGNSNSGNNEERSFVKLTSKTSPKKKTKFVMPVPPKRLAEIKANKIKEGIKPDFIKLMGYLMRSQTPKKYNKKKELAPKDTTKREMLWEQKIARTDPKEDVFKQKIRQLAANQEKTVLANLDNIKYYTAESKKASVETLFDLASENRAFTAVLLPFIRDFMTDEGNYRLFQMGFNQPFDTATERAQNFLKNDGLAFIKDRDGINTTTLDNLRKTLSEGLASGDSIDQLKNRVQSVYQQLGSVRADMIARTEVSRAVNFGALEAYQQSGIVSNKEWLTAKDERVCPWCNSMDGKVISISNKFFKEGDELTVDGKTLTFGLTDVKSPPLHVSCRCDLLPIVN